MALRGSLGKRKRDGFASRPQKRMRRGRKMKRRQRRGRPYTKMMRQPVADKVMTRMNYSEVLSMSMTASGVMQTYQFRNSIFDPDVTSAGHQPLWHDQMALLYKRYRVHGIKYRFTVVNSNIQQMACFVVKHSSSGITDTNYNTLRERRGIQRTVLNPNTGPPRVIKGFMHAGKPHGLTKRDFLADEDFEANFGSNPVKSTYLELYGVMYHTNAIFYIQADLQYYVELLDRIDASGS